MIYSTKMAQETALPRRLRQGKSLSALYSRPMQQARDNWSRMIKALVAFRNKFGHCNVPANYRHYLQLGRWVAAQRHRKKVGTLAIKRQRELEGLGITWSADAHAWERMFQALVQFQLKHGTCNVPGRWPENQRLGRWVQGQRQLKKLGKLSADKVRRLEQAGFVWAIYKAAKPAPAPKAAAGQGPAPQPVESGERLYHLGNSDYVQYNGQGEIPRELTQYLDKHHGEHPPFMLLPSGTTEFWIGGLYLSGLKVRWKGSGKLPEKVFDYVRKNGVLPPHL